MKPDTPATRKCANCTTEFAISEQDRAFYAKIETPPPTWCPTCRRIRRHAHVNDYVYYNRSCDSCGKKFVATFPATSGYHVICQSCWYSENRNDRAEARDYDLSKPFFEQFDALMHVAPQLGNIAINCENSEYCESIADCKNCYLISECSNCEDCFYAYWIQRTRDSLDCCYLHECERCYEVSDSFNCYELRYSSNCRNCSDSAFLDNCIGCSNCICSVNLRHKKHHIFNKPYSPEEYEREVRKLFGGSLRGPSTLTIRAEVAKQFDLFLRAQPRKHLQMELVENSFGDYVRNAKNCSYVFHCYDAEDCSYGEHVWRGAKDCMDVQTAGRDAELIYESTNTNMGSYFAKFCRYCWGCRFTEYSNMCVGGSYLFGCVGLKPGARYCILNKEYREPDYLDLTKKIRERMLADGEYGEFFPLSIALFGYNNTVSYDERSYSREEVLTKGWKWEDTASGTVGQGTIKMEGLPDYPNADVCNGILTCEWCNRNYRIIRKEFDFYVASEIPIPRACPDCRHRARLRRRNPKRIESTLCTSCNRNVTTTLDPTVYSRILCSECYEQEIY